MSERKLATIRACGPLSDIPKADYVEMAQVDGWQCVVKKGEFTEGALGVYIEIDSLLPIEPRWEFLRKSSLRNINDKFWFRIKTAKFKKQISQGLFVPLAEFPELASKEAGADVSEALGIIQYEPPVKCVVGQKGNFPWFLIKTDQERFQNMPVFKLFAGDWFEVTIKLDGTSASYYYYNNEFGVCSRNMALDLTSDNHYTRVAKKYHLEELLKIYSERHPEMPSIALQGEIIGPGIQGNNDQLESNSFHIFDVMDIANRRLLLPIDRYKIIGHLNQILRDKEDKDTVIVHVPVLEAVQLGYNGIETNEDLLNLAQGYSLNPKVEREGIVLKGLNKRVSFKVISNKYLLADQS